MRLASGDRRLGRCPGHDARVIRIGRPADAEAIALVHETARRAYYAGEGQAWQLPHEAAPERLETWQLLLGDPARATVHCAVTDGRMVGFLSMGPPLHDSPTDEEVLELHALFVLPDSWSGGIGSELHAGFTERLSSGPEGHGALEVWGGNSRALAFYRRRGWTPDGRSRTGPDGINYLGLTLSQETHGRAAGPTPQPR